MYLQDKIKIKNEMTIQKEGETYEKTGQTKN